MSPVGGVRIDLTIQDAVAAANILRTPLREHRVRTEELVQVQRLRKWSTWMTQRARLMVQHRVITPVLEGTSSLSPPLVFRILA